MKPLLPMVAILSFAGTASLSAAASPPTNGQIHAVIERIIAEEAGSDIECRVSRLDLDADGADEVLFRFPVGAHGSQTRVIRWVDGKEQILFDEGRGTPSSRFIRVEGTPAVLLEDSNYEPSYVDSTRTETLFVWNGKGFSHVPGYDCVLEHHVYDRNGLTFFSNISDHCQPTREEIPWLPCSAYRTP